MATDNKNEVQTMYEKIRDNIESTWPDWKIELANAELITSKHGKKLRTKAEREQDKKETSTICTKEAELLSGEGGLTVLCLSQK